MALNEREQRELAEGLEGGLGRRTAELMIRHSAPVDISHLATKDALQALDHKVDLMEQRLIAEIHRVGRNQLLGFAAVMAVFNTGLFAAISFIAR